MRGHRLREILQDIQHALRVGGGAKQADALDRLSKALATRDADNIEAISASIAGALDGAAASRWQRHAEALKKAGYDEQLFQLAFASLQKDKTLKKADIAQIASDYGVRAGSKTSADKLLHAIRGSFFERLYNRDADEMAKRARPW